MDEKDLLICEILNCKNHSYERLVEELSWNEEQDKIQEINKKAVIDANRNVIPM